MAYSNKEEGFEKSLKAYTDAWDEYDKWWNGASTGKFLLASLGRVWEERC